MGLLVELTEGLPLFLILGIFMAYQLGTRSPSGSMFSAAGGVGFWGSMAMWFSIIALIHVGALHEDSGFYVIFGVLLTGGLSYLVVEARNERRPKPRVKPNPYEQHDAQYLVTPELKRLRARHEATKAGRPIPQWAVEPTEEHQAPAAHSGLSSSSPELRAKRKEPDNVNPQNTKSFIDEEYRDRGRRLFETGYAHVLNAEEREFFRQEKLAKLKASNPEMFGHKKPIGPDEALQQ